MKTKNVSYAYNTEYLESILLNKNAQDLNKELLRMINGSKEQMIAFGKGKIKKITSNDKCVFKAIYKTNYPGMIFGTGNPHETKNDAEKKNSEGQLEVGFNFDFVTGFPVYPGSSLKGAIRSPIQHAEKEAEYQKYLSEIISDAIHKDVVIDKEKANTLLNVFEENEDVFYDVYVTYVEDNVSKIMDIDYITPHGDPLKDPTPISMLRLMPGVNITVCIKIKDDCDLGEFVITPEQRFEIYNSIIQDFGLGAKTNVGYGKLTKKK